MRQPQRVVVMRGGNSRALVFRGEDLPTEIAAQDRIFLAALGCPDPTGRQVDGLGGGASSNNKVAIVGPSKAPGIDVDFALGSWPPTARSSTAPATRRYLGRDRSIRDRKRNRRGNRSPDEGHDQEHEHRQHACRTCADTGRPFPSRRRLRDRWSPRKRSRIMLDFVEPDLREHPPVTNGRHPTG